MKAEMRDFVDYEQANSEPAEEQVGGLDVSTGDLVLLELPYFLPATMNGQFMYWSWAVVIRQCGKGYVALALEGPWGPGAFQSFHISAGQVSAIGAIDHVVSELCRKRVASNP